MNMPGFDAESSLGPTIGTYRGRAVFGGLGTSEVSMSQFDISSLNPSLKTRFWRFTMTCCGYSTLLHRIVCTTSDVSPFEQCECQRGYYGDPVIICRPPVFSPD
jgi:hypothetical protein